MAQQLDLFDEEEIREEYEEDLEDSEALEDLDLSEETEEEEEEVSEEAEEKEEKSEEVEGKEEETPSEESPEDSETSSSDLEELRAQNQQLLEKINDLMAGKGAQSPQETQPEQTSAADKAPTPELVDFIGDQDVDELLSSKEGVNNLLNQVFQKGLTTGSENILKTVPQIIQHQVQTQTLLQKKIDAFYSDNEDLVPVRQTVGAVVNQVAAEHSDWAIDDILEETGKQVRTMLGLKEAAQSKGDAPGSQKSSTPTRARKPALPKTKSGGQRGGGPELSEQQKQINSIL